MSRSLTLTAWALSFLTLTTGHGGGMYYTIDGVTHTGNYYELNNDRSIQLEWDWDAAEYLEDPRMACGFPATPAKDSYHAPIKAGSEISVNYTGPAELGWVHEPTHLYTFGHDRGPMTAYLAPCPDTGCETVDVNAPIWVKIFEADLISGNWKHGHWAMADVFWGANLTIPTPKTLKPGKYLLRHEMNNLSNGGQWFANCIQLDFSGEGTASLPTEVGVAVSFGAGDERDAYAKDNGPEGSFCKLADGCLGAAWFFGPWGEKTTYPNYGPPIWLG